MCHVPKQAVSLPEANKVSKSPNYIDVSHLRVGGHIRVLERGETKGRHVSGN